MSWQHKDQLPEHVHRNPPRANICTLAKQHQVHMTGAHSSLQGYKLHPYQKTESAETAA